MSSLVAFDKLIKKVEHNLQSAEQNAQNLSRKFTHTSTQLKDAEKTLEAHRQMVRKTELKIAGLVSSHAQTKRTLNKLYADLVSLVLKKKTKTSGLALGGSIATSHEHEQRAWEAPPQLLWQLGRLNAIAITTDTNIYLQYIKDFHRELMASLSEAARTPSSPMPTARIDTFLPLCTNDLFGKCSNLLCPLQHLSVTSTSSKVGVGAGSLLRFRQLQYGRFCRTQRQNYTVKLVEKRKEAMKQRVINSNSSPNQRYFHVDSGASQSEYVVEGGAHQDWRIKFADNFWRYFEPSLEPAPAGKPQLVCFKRIYLFLKKGGLESGALLMSLLPPVQRNDSIGLETTAKDGRSSKTQSGENKLGCRTVSGSGIGEKETRPESLLQACLVFVSASLRTHYCDCGGEDGQSQPACAHSQRELLGADSTDPLHIKDINCILKHTANVVSSSHHLAVELLWDVYLTLLLKLPLMQRPLVESLATMLSAAFPASKIIAVSIASLLQKTCLKLPNFGMQDSLPDNASMKTSRQAHWGEYILHEYLKDLTVGERVMYASSTNSTLSLAICAQVDAICLRSYSLELVVALLCALLDIPEILTRTTDVESDALLLGSDYAIMKCVNNPEIIKSFREAINVEDKLILWTALLSLLSSGQTNAVGIWWEPSRLPSLPWEEGVQSLRDIISWDAGSGSKLLAVLQAMLLETGISCQHYSSPVGEADADAGATDASKGEMFQMTFDIASSLTDELSALSGISNDQAMHGRSASMNNMIWYFCLQLLEAMRIDTRGLYQCICLLCHDKGFSFLETSALCGTIYPNPTDAIKSCLSCSIVPDDSPTKLLNLSYTAEFIQELNDLLDFKNSAPVFASGVLARLDLMKSDSTKNILDLCKRFFWNFPLLLDSRIDPYTALVAWLAVGHVDSCFTAANMWRLKLILCGEESLRLFRPLGISYLLKILSAVVLMLPCQKDILKETVCFVADIWEEHLLCAVCQPLSSSLSGHPGLLPSGAIGRISEGRCAYLEHVHVIEIMNTLLWSYGSDIEVISVLIYLIDRARPLLSTVDILIAHLLNALLAPAVKVNSSACYVAAASATFPLPRQLVEMCKLSIPFVAEQAKVFSIITQALESWVLGENNFTNYFHNELSYCGSDWSGYEALSELSSSLLLRLGTLFFHSEMYLCVYTIQQELIGRLARSSLDVACCYHLVSMSGYDKNPQASLLLHSNLPSCSLAISEPFVETSTCPIQVLHEIYSAVSSAHSKCNLEGAFQGLIPLAISAAAPALDDLNVTHCAIVEFPLHLLSISTLTRLNMSHNQLDALPVDEFSRSFSSLNFLDLSFNAFTSFPSELSKLKSLQELYMNDNQIEYISDRLLQMKLLKVFDLSNNKLKALPPGIMALKRQIQFLKLSGNPMISLVGGKTKGGRSAISAPALKATAMPAVITKSDVAESLKRAREVVDSTFLPAKKINIAEPEESVFEMVSVNRPECLSSDPDCAGAMDCEGSNDDEVSITILQVRSEPRVVISLIDDSDSSIVSSSSEEEQKGGGCDEEKGKTNGNPPSSTNNTVISHQEDAWIQYSEASEQEEEDEDDYCSDN